MENFYFWFLWWATLVVCSWKFIEGIWRPQKMLEWPFIACAMWAYFYVYMAFYAKTTLSDYLPEGSSVLGQLMPLVCLIAIILGWNVGLQSRIERKVLPAQFSLGPIWIIGIVLIGIGSYGAYKVFFANVKGEYDYQNTSAYLTLLFYVGYPGLALSVWALSKVKTSSRFWLWVITLLALGVFIYPHIHNARRGPTFPAVLILLLMPALTQKRHPRRFVFLGGLIIVGLVMLAFVEARQVVYNDGTWVEAIKQVNEKDVLKAKAEQVSDNEYVNNCQLIWTLYKGGKYQYGTGHLELLVHWIPRKIWTSKPILGEGYYSYDELFNDVELVTGFHFLGGGAAAGGVADTFVQYGFLTPLFWFILSWVVGKIYFLARQGDAPSWEFSYVAFICATHWLVSQGFNAAFVPGMYFIIVPLVVLWFCRKDAPRLKRSRHRPAPRHVEEPVNS